jgi:tyramine---L-glutamate ligase
MNKLKILVFEYITGGGCNRAELPESLASEGLLMLQALLDDLAELHEVETVLMLDERMQASVRLPPTCDLHYLTPEHEVWDVFDGLIDESDAVWPLAPETGGLLARLCRLVQNQGKHLLCPGANAVEITGDKWLCYHQLVQCEIPTVPTFLPEEWLVTDGEWLVKPRDGAGALDTLVFNNPESCRAYLMQQAQDSFLVQPHVEGRKTSLSCLFREGQGWLLCANRQEFALENGRYRMTGLLVNMASDRSLYQSLVECIAQAFPELWGYAGIDLIEQDGQISVLEINPRLTTSYVGIKPALGLSCAGLTLELLEGSPRIQPARNHTVPITPH